MFHVNQKNNNEVLMNNIDTVKLDLDGTLLDTLSDLTDSVISR